MKSIPVSLYFMPEWWDAHYHAKAARPARKNQSELEAMYRGRQRFLFEQLGEFGIGQEIPDPQNSQLGTVIRYGFDLIPALLGTQFDYAGAWGFYPRFRPLESFHAVNIAGHAEGEWLLKEKQRLESLYGKATYCIDMASVSNNAFRILGDAFYLDLLTEPQRLSDLFEAILEPERSRFRFLWEHFGPIPVVPISNCNVDLMGPSTYESQVLAWDSRQACFAQEAYGVNVQCAVHHCDYPADKFMGAYAKLPGLKSVQASFQSDIGGIKRTCPGVEFSALLSPPSMTGNLEEFEKILDRAIVEGADDLAVWNVDPQTDIPAMRRILKRIQTTCRNNGSPAVFSAYPLCWEELEWAHAKYQGNNDD